MKKTELALVFITLMGFFAIAAFLLTGHSGFASKFVNVFFFVLVVESGIRIFNS